MIDFFASGHALVEGLIAHFADSREGRVGRVGRLELTMGREAGEGVAVIYTDGPDIDVLVMDSAGRLRPDWAAAFHQRPLPVRPLRAQKARHVDWAALLSRLDSHTGRARAPHAIAGIVVRPA